jgi:endonuclease YncB( thermonuclease family)
VGEWTVPATVVSIVDGDTFHLDLDLGWHITYQARVRIAHVNAPELSTAVGIAARVWAESVIKPGDSVVFHSKSLDKWGRPLGDMAFGPAKSRIDYGTALLGAGHADKMK